jgi:hypothetical protein
MCSGIPILGKALSAAPQSPIAPAAVSPAATSDTTPAELKRRQRSLLSAASALGDPSAAVTSAGAAIGKTALGQ